MTSKENFENFIIETINYPYFSTLYDMGMWKEDKENILKCLEVLEILKKHIILPNVVEAHLIFDDMTEYYKLKELLDK